MPSFPWEKSYPPGVKWALDIPKKPLYQLFEDACAQYGDRPFTDFLDKVMTFRDYKEASDRAAAGFQKLGVKPGVNVGLYLPNTPHYIIAFFGVLKAGGKVVNYSPLDAARELEFKIGDSETDILVTLDVARSASVSTIPPSRKGLKTARGSLPATRTSRRGGVSTTLKGPTALLTSPL